MSEPTGFHVGPGWWFSRQDDGQILILAPDSMGPGATQAVRLTPEDWASVVAFIADGGSGESYRAARELYGG